MEADMNKALSRSWGSFGAGLREIVDNVWNLDEKTEDDTIWDAGFLSIFSNTRPPKEVEFPSDPWYADPSMMNKRELLLGSAIFIYGRRYYRVYQEEKMLLNNIRIRKKSAFM